MGFVQQRGMDPDLEFLLHLLGDPVLHFPFLLFVTEAFVKGIQFDVVLGELDEFCHRGFDIVAEPLRTKLLFDAFGNGPAIHRRILVVGETSREPPGKFPLRHLSQEGGRPDKDDRPQEQRDDAQKKGVNVVAVSGEAKERSDIIVNVSEKKLAEEAETMENILGVLDGQLSLKNATVLLDI